MTGALAPSTGPELWYLTRASGIVALVLLTATMVTGVLSSVGWVGRNWPRFLSQTLHRNLSLLSLVFVGLHVVSTVADGFVPISVIDAFVPFASPYRPIWIGLGAVAMDLLLAVLITSALRSHIGLRAWRAVHWAAYACWPVALLHSLGSGTDTRLGPVLAIEIACVAAVLASVVWRLAAGWPRRAALRVATGASAVALVLGVAVFAVAGPLAPGWAQRAAAAPVVAHTSQAERG